MSSEIKNEKRLDFVVAKEGSKPLILSPEKLKELVSRGEIKGDDLIFQENLKVWTKARSVKGLRSLVAKVESSSNSELTDDSDEDFLDDALNEPDVAPEKDDKVGSTGPSKYSELPPILAAALAAKNSAKDAALSKINPEDRVNQALTKMQSGEVAPGPYPEIKLPSASAVKTYFQYAIIGCFGLVLLYHFFPRSSGELVSGTEYLHGNITLNGEPLRNGSIVVMGGDGKEVYGFVEPRGTYRVENPPKGMLKMKVISFPPPPPGMFEPKKDLKAKAKEKPVVSPVAKYASFDNEISIDYQGGAKLFDLKLSSK